LLLVFYKFNLTKFFFFLPFLRRSNGICFVKIAVPVEEHSPLGQVVVYTKSQAIKGRAGENVTLNCEFSLSGSSAVQIWSRLNPPSGPMQVISINGDLFGGAKPSDYETIVGKEKDGKTLNQLVLRNVSKQNVAQYACMFSNDQDPAVIYNVTVLGKRTSLRRFQLNSNF
jgi:hypothetical protein